MPILWNEQEYTKYVQMKNKFEEILINMSLLIIQKQVLWVFTLNLLLEASCLQGHSQPILTLIWFRIPACFQTATALYAITIEQFQLHTNVDSNLAFTHSRRNGSDGCHGMNPKGGEVILVSSVSLYSVQPHS